jgi:hypothetical protein
MLRYYVIGAWNHKQHTVIAQSNYNLNIAAGLTSSIPNRVVKPAQMVLQLWESICRFLKPFTNVKGFVLKIKSVFLFKQIRYKEWLV